MTAELTGSPSSTALSNNLQRALNPSPGDNDDEMPDATAPSLSVISVVAPETPDLPLQLISSALAVGPTLLPPHIASLITALSLATKVSLRATAFVIEAILESCRYGTSLGLGLTRRALVSAVASARTLYALREGKGGAESLPGGIKRSLLAQTDDAFFGVLDRYTNLGVYIVTHTLTLAELFTMSGFYLTSTTVRTGIAAAQESVSLFDGIFGSNESSRALASIIGLVRRELVEEERFADKKKGSLSNIAALTKALTAFACLQNSTSKRTNGSIRQTILFDYTVVGEVDQAWTGQEISSISVGDPSNGGTQPSAAPHLPRGAEAASERRGGRRVGPNLVYNSPEASPVEAEAASDIQLDLEELVGQGSDDPEGSTPINRDHREGRLSRDDVFEITESITEHITETQTVEHYRSSDFAGVHEKGHPWPRIEAVGDEALEDDWVEVEHMLGPADKQPLDGALTSIASDAYRDAMEHPQANSVRVQVILKTITRKLLEKKRTIRRLASDPSSSSPFTVPGRGRRNSPLPDPDGDDDVEVDEVEELVSNPAADSPSGPIEDNLSTLAIYPRKATQPRTFRQIVARSRLKASSAFSSGRFPKISSSESINSSPLLTRPSFIPSSSASPSDEDAVVRADCRTTASRAGSDRPLPPLPTAESSMSMASPKSAVLLQPLLERSSERYASTDDVELPSSLARRRSGPGSTVAPKRKTPRLRQPSNTSLHSVVTQHSEFRSHAQTAPADKGEPEGLFPRDHLIKNIHKFCRYASAAYGQNFLRILGLGATEFMFPSTGRHHANSWAFAHHTNLPIDALLLSSFVELGPSMSQEKLAPLVYYIAVDHASKAIVLTCRGTLGLSDVLIDLTCSYEPIEVDGGDPGATYLAHGGMLYSARKLMDRSSTVHETIKKALLDFPNYGLVLTGHSLGGGVAALLSVLWSCPADHFIAECAKQSARVPHPIIFTPFVTSLSSGLPPGRPVHSYVYGPPCVASSDLVHHTEGLITSVIQGNDIVPTLSLGVLRDFKNVAVTMSDEGNVAEEIVGRTIGIYQRRLRSKYGPSLLRGSTEPSLKTLQEAEAVDHPSVDFSEAELAQGRSRNYVADPDYKDPAEEGTLGADESDERKLDDWFFSLIKTMRADMSSEKLYPSGRVYQMEHWTVFVTADKAKLSPSGSNKGFSHQEGHRIVLRLVEDVEKKFGEPNFSRSMFNDHLPTKYEHSTQLLYDGLCGS